MTTYYFAVGLMLLGMIFTLFYPVPKAVPAMLLIAALIVLFLRVTGALATELPVPPPGVTIQQMRAAIADQERRKKATPKRFEDMLSSPIGKGRLE